MKDLRRILFWVAGGFLIAVVAIGGYLESRYRVIRTAPRVDRAVLVGDSSVQGFIDPSVVQPMIKAALQEELGRGVPDWLLDWVMPYEAGGTATLNFDAHRVELDLYLNTPRLDPELARRGQDLDLRNRLAAITWNTDGITGAEPGLLRLEGTMRMEPEAEDAYWYTWNQSVTPPRIALEGGHFVEVLLDNRRGAAYLVFASLIDAFDVDLDAKYQDISLSSLQFVETVHLTIDPTPTGALGVRIRFAIVPEAIDRLGVVNMKVAIEDAMKELMQQLAQKGVEMTGAAEWDESGIVYEYVVKDATEAIRLGMRGELF